MNESSQSISCRPKKREHRCIIIIVAMMAIIAVVMVLDFSASTMAMTGNSGTTPKMQDPKGSSSNWVSSSTPSSFVSKESKYDVPTTSNPMQLSTPSFLPFSLERESTVPTITIASLSPSHDPTVLTYPDAVPSPHFLQPPLEPQSKDTQSIRNTFGEIKFYVLGDIPYSHRQERMLVSQLKDIEKEVLNATDEAAKQIFIVHVGDLMSAYFSKCVEERYHIISKIFKETVSVPVLTTPGDNEWNKCPDIDAAMSNYTNYFVGLENNWKNHPIAASIQRSLKRGENWAFMYSNVLFISFNMIYEEFTEHSNPSERLNDNIQWFDDICGAYSCVKARAIVVFGHSISNSYVIFDHIDTKLGKAAPVIYFSGHFHQFKIKRGVGKGKISGFWRVQVEKGMRSAPLSVTIKGDDQETMGAKFFAIDEDRELVLANLIKIDRRIYNCTYQLN